MSIEVKTHPLNIAVVRFPGSNCDYDTLNFFQREGHNPQFLWHTESVSPEADLLVLPGGFAFGDRVYQRATGEFSINPGVQALESPVMDVVRKWADEGKPVLGICNGFQILTHAKILPGVLLENESGHFFCNDIDVRVEGRSFFNEPELLGNVYQINVAHGFGRYNIDDMTYQKLMMNGQIFLRYHGFNPNGSFADIAGVCNERGNVFGMMPHPERADSKTGQFFLKAIENYVRS